MEHEGEVWVEDATEEEVLSPSEEEMERARANEPPGEDPTVKEEQAPKEQALTAFVVVVGTDGSAYALRRSADLDRFVLAREPNMGDIFRGCAEVCKDVQAIDTSHRVVDILRKTANPNP